MPHIPGHNRPFTSFLTQGMQNTNQNLNTMSMPNNQINFPKYPNPSELPMQPGFQGVGNFYNKPMPKGPSELPMQQDFIGTGNIKPVEEPALGNQIDFPNYLQEQPQDPIDYGSLLDMYDAKPYMQGTINDMFEWQYDELTGEWSQQYIGDPSDLEAAQIGGIDLGGLNMGFDFGFGGMTDNLYNTMNPQAPTFTGGGGQGGQLARQLYYPGTSGGFAGVGSGLNPNMLQNLLNRG